jgi:hypothetical protein
MAAVTHMLGCNGSVFMRCQEVPARQHTLHGAWLVMRVHA